MKKRWLYLAVILVATVLFCLLAKLWPQRSTQLSATNSFQPQPAAKQLALLSPEHSTTSLPEPKPSEQAAVQNAIETALPTTLESLQDEIARYTELLANEHAIDKLNSNILSKPETQRYLQIMERLTSLRAASTQIKLKNLATEVTELEQAHSENLAAFAEPQD